MYEFDQRTSVSSDRWRVLNSLIVFAISDVGSLACQGFDPQNDHTFSVYRINYVLPEQEQQLPTVDLAPESLVQPT